MVATASPPIVRLAPSPTGRLHIGNARTALLNWLFAKQRGGKFILRYDDTDRERSTAEFAAGIAEDLAWLGIEPDAVVRYLYTLPSVVDDIDLSITHVIRGEDHVTNTGVQIQLFEALAAAPPAFAHHNLLTLASGEGLSKRLGHLALGNLRQSGLEPTAVAALAVLIGTSHAVAPIAKLEDLVGKVELSDISHSAAKFDEAELAQLNARTLHHMPYADAAPRLHALAIEGGEAFRQAVKGNLSKFSDAAEWWKVVTGPIAPVIAPEDRDFVRVAGEHLPLEPFGSETWGRWTEALKQSTGRKGKSLFRPSRLALTAREEGPELKALLPLIGRAHARKRLHGEIA